MSLPPPSLPRPGQWVPPVAPSSGPAPLVVVPKRSKHGFHLTMTIFTFGLWAPVWVVCAILNAGRTTREPR